MKGRNVALALALALSSSAAVVDGAAHSFPGGGGGGSGSGVHTGVPMRPPHKHKSSGTLATVVNSTPDKQSKDNKEVKPEASPNGAAPSSPAELSLSPLLKLSGGKKTLKARDLVAYGAAASAAAAAIREMAFRSQPTLTPAPVQLMIDDKPVLDASGSNAWHAMGGDQCLDVMGVTSEGGLESAQASQLLEQYGPNELTAAPRPSILALIMDQFADRLVQILLGVAVMSAVLSIWEDDPTAYLEPLVIVSILVINAAVGVWQSRSAEGAIDALSKLQPSLAVALRDGEWQSELPARELVPGDIILIRVGDKVPADARLLKFMSSTFSVDEGSLTGESVTVSKSLEPVEPDAPIQGKTNMIFAGTMVTVGNAYAVVTDTAMNTEIGKIQSGVQAAKTDEEKTPLAQKLDEFGDQLSGIIAAVCVAVWCINIPRFSAPALGGKLQGALHYAKVAVALGVAAIPEGLPAVITLCLSLGTRRMAARNVIVRKLPSVETLGCTTVICTDKTGTLTTNQMTAVSLVQVTAGKSRRVPALLERAVEGVSYSTIGGIQGLETSDMAARNLQELKECAALCNNAAIFYEEGQYKHAGEPTEAALKVLAEKMTSVESPVASDRVIEPAELCRRGSAMVEEKWKRVATLEFNRDRKSMSVLVKKKLAPSASAAAKKNAEARLYVKGAPEMLLKRCTHVRMADGSKLPITDAFRAEITDKIQDMAARPLRTMGLAVKDGKDLPPSLQKWEGDDSPPTASGDAPKPPPLLADPNNFAKVESGLTFLGVVGIKDPARPEVADAISQCSSAGVRVMMITGDSKPTAVAIAKDVNVFNDNTDTDADAFTGAEFFSKLSEEEQLAKLSSGRNLVFCRTEPMDKQKLVKMLQFLGETPAMTGDGVNDAPALQQAAIGVAMGITGTEVSKEAADMVLADDNFATIVAAVEEGRCIYNNMQAFICFLISCNFGEIATVFFSTLAGFPEPLTPLQLLWVNLVTDGPPATALGFNPPDPDSMSKSPRSRSAPIMSPWLLTRYLVTGLYVGTATIGVMLWWFYDNGVNPLQLATWTSCPAWLTNENGFMPAGVDIAAEPFLMETSDPCSIFMGNAKAKAQTLALSVLVCMEMFKALSAVSVNNSLLAVPPWKNPYLLAGVALPFSLHILVLQVPSFAKVFGLVGLTKRDWKRVMVCSLPIIFLEEILKAIGRLIEVRAESAKAAAMQATASPAEATPPAM